MLARRFLKGYLEADVIREPDFLRRSSASITSHECNCEVSDG